VKLWKWHTLTFKCPRCGDETDYALQVSDGPHKGTSWDPSYWCACCNTAVHAREPWLFGAVYGPLMALVAALAYDTVSHGGAMPVWARIAFAGGCCAVIGWPLSRCLSRYLVSWEARGPRPRAQQSQRFRP
jgi:hypothetical protein